MPGPLSPESTAPLVKALMDRNAASVDASPTSVQPSNAGRNAALTALIGGQALDAGTTMYGLHNGAHETNSLYGSNPSDARILATKAAIHAPIALLVSKLYKTHPKLAQGLGYLDGAAGAIPGVMNLHTLQK